MGYVFIKIFVNPEWYFLLLVIAYFVKNKRKTLFSQAFRMILVWKTMKFQLQKDFI